MATKEAHRKRVTAHLSAHLLETGLAEISLRQLAAAAGVSDRMLLYYFEDKTEVLRAGLEGVAIQVSEMLEALVPHGRKLPPGELLAVVSDLVRDPASQSFFRLWMQAIAAASRKEAPFEEIAKGIAEGFLEWIADRLEGGTDTSRRAQAAMILAMLDGLALLEICTDTERREMAISQMVQLAHPEADTT